MTTERRLHFPTFRKLLSRLSHHRRAFILAIGIVVVNTAAAVAGPRLIGYIIDAVLLPGKTTLLPLFAVLFISLEAIRVLSARSQSIRFVQLGQAVMNELRQELYAKILSLPFLHIRSASVGGLTARLSGDVATLSTLFDAAFLRIIERLCTVAGIVIGIISIQPILGSTALALLIPFILLGTMVTRVLFRAFHDIRHYAEGMNASLSETIRGLPIIHIFGLASTRLEHFTRRSDALRTAQLIPPHMFGILHPAMTIVIGTSVMILLWWGGLMTERGQLSPGELVTLLSYMVWIFWPILFIVNQWSIFLQGMAAADRIFEALAWKGESGSTHPFPSDQPMQINFESVHFSYPGADRGVQCLSLSIRAGEVVGVVGASGSGKTTLIRLLLRFIDPDSGRITLNGLDLREYLLQDLRKNIGLIPQHPKLFEGSIRRNVTLWDLHDLQEYEAPDSLPPRIRELLDRPAGRSMKLSTGEQQVIAFLRAAVRRPKLWILDEPSSSLDPELEQWVHRELDRIRGKSAVLIIAHRLDTLRRADRILVLQDGVLYEQGTHDQLIQRDGLYRRLYELQRDSETVDEACPGSGSDAG